MRLFAAWLFFFALPGCGRSLVGGFDAAVADLAMSDSDGSLVPDDGAAPEVVRFAVIGDYGSGSQDERRVADLVKAWGPDFIVTAGDNN